MKNYSLLCDKISEILSSQKVSSLREDFARVSDTYRKQNISSNIVVSKDSEVLAYLSTRMCATTSISYDVLNRVFSMCDNKVDTVLDVGSGTGAVLWAIDDVLGGSNITALETEDNMLKYSRILSQDLSSNIDYVKGNILSSNTMSKLGKFDMVIESFMLNELSDSDRLLALDNMCSKTSDYLVLIEPGTPKSYERMMSIRDYVLDKGFSLVLPCPHSEKCGLCDDYCNFSTRVQRTSIERRVKGGMLSYEDEKYFYLVFRLGECDVRPHSVVLRHPVYRKNCVDLKLCDADTTIRSITVTKSDKDRYKISKSLSHGDICDF